MKPYAANRWLLIAIPALIVAFGLAGCTHPTYVPPPLPGGPAAPPPPPQVSRQVLYVQVSHLNLRACPGMDCPKISMLERGEEVEKVGASEDWFQIRVKRDGRLGWVDSRYLSPTPPVIGPEVAPPPPPPETAPPPPPERMPPPLQERPAPPLEKFKPAPPEEEVPPAKQKPVEAKPAKPAKAKPEEPGEAAPKETKPAPQEQKPAPAPAPEETPAPGQKIRIM